jgi:membrane-associated phospholipid phosphatase
VIRLIPVLLVLLLAGQAFRTQIAPRIGRETPKWLPNGWVDALRQLGLFALADICYETVRGVAEGNAALAFDNARTIVDLEQGGGLFFEQGLQAWVMAHRLLVDFANFMYVNSHFVITTTFLVWLYLRRNRQFYFVRNMFMVAMGMALIGYLALPTAPPRFFPELGFVDTIAYYADVRHDSAFVALFFNPYAAVPSMHVAFALMISIPAALLVRRTVSKLAWASYPALVTLVVIATGNHWWLDAVAGAFVALVAALVARTVLSRVRPAAWAWRPTAAEAAA